MTSRVVDDRALARTAGAPLVAGNAVRILQDARENYAAWLEAIANATRTIHFECYIIHGDEIGMQFAEALAERARAGVHVRVLRDWFGAMKFGNHRVWPTLKRAGVDARTFNPPHLDHPLGWISRDHRKALTIDGRLAFVAGLCVGHDWVGDPARHIEPWRDMGLSIEGPAVAHVDLAFAHTWALTGAPVPSDDLADPALLAPAGDVAVRVVASTPASGHLYRLDQMITAEARRSLWLTDAYFVGTTPYVLSLSAAARDGVDVRLLVPGASDVPFVRGLSRAGYRPLLEAGVRIFEWNGSMLHAKTAVADSRWARIGSTNLNITSWIGNWELDVAIHDEPLAEAMERIYERDLTNATEIVLTARRDVRPREPRPSPRPGGVKRRSAGRRAVAGALGIGSAVGAMRGHRTLGPAEARVMATVGALLLLAAAVIVYWPLLLTVPVGAMLAWGALSLLYRASRLIGK